MASPREPLTDVPSLLDALVTQARVVGALVRRDLRANTGETRLGYLWALIEPAAHLGVFILIFSYILPRHSPLNGSITLFLLTGLIPWFLYGKVADAVRTSVGRNRALLGLPPVKTLDILIGAGTVEAATYILVACILFGVLAMSGEPLAIPCEPLTLGASIIVIVTFGFGIGMINAVIQSYVYIWGTLFSLLSAPLYFFSGIWFLPEEVPRPFRDYLLYNPILQLVSWFRMGFYADYKGTYFYPAYAIWWAVALLVLGIALQRIAQRQLLAPT